MYNGKIHSNINTVLGAPEFSIFANVLKRKKRGKYEALEVAVLTPHIAL